MNKTSEEASARPCWFVGTSFGGSNDQTERFLRDGIWEHGYDNDHPSIATTKTMQIGDRIAMKATYTRKLDLPFKNNGQFVSVMAIKATGTVTENTGDGHTVRVDWTRVEPKREWYMHVYMKTIWEVTPGRDGWFSDALIGFAFNSEEQEISRFLQHETWAKKYFPWTNFYMAFADKLLAYKDNRADLLAKIHAVAKRNPKLYLLQDRFSDDTTGPLKDICPFTIIGMFNRQIKDSNRKIVATELAKELGVSEPVPDKLGGIPVVDNRSSWFFGFKKDRKSDDIDSLWDAFSCGMSFSDSENTDTRSAFISAYDKVTKLPHVGWKQSFGLYWIRPWSFPSLDTLGREYIEKELGIKISLNGPNKRCTAKDYLKVRDDLNTRFKEEDCPVGSLPQLAYKVWTVPPTPTDPYALDDIVKDGCFIERNKLEKILDRLRTKKNLILQGPPGTGKTWLAKKLAFALVGHRDESKIRPVQFHPNLSYEDFVRGWRPAGDGKLTLVDGPFIALRNEAVENPDTTYVMVIEEINRGNPAQIFGELLTLLEADKRTPNEALELIYKQSHDERVYIPDNLHVIGTMNIADRSLALVDLALRRRFAFIDLEPTLGEPWRVWVHTKCGIEIDVLNEIENHIVALNNTISDDTSLGSQFCVGHSYVTPGSQIGDARKWYREVVDTEIGPLLDEYWFDNLERSKSEKQKLLKGFS